MWFQLLKSTVPLSLLVTVASAQRPPAPPNPPSPRAPVAAPLVRLESLNHEWELRAAEMELHRVELQSRAHELQSLSRVWAEEALRAGALEGLEVERAWEAEPSSGKGVASLRPVRGTPEDSLYQLARQALNRGEYAKAAELFSTYQERYPTDRSAPAALYWRAFALYRSGSTGDLRAALAALELQRTRYPNTSQDADGAALQTRIQAALASRGDERAAQALRTAGRQGASCDKEEMEVRAEALNALSRIDPVGSEAILGRIMSQRDECSVTLRRRAVYLLGGLSEGSHSTATAALLEAARNDPDRSVRTDAIAILGRTPGDQTVDQLEELFRSATDARIQAAVFAALRNHGSPAARLSLRRFIERTDLEERTRAEAVNAFVMNSLGYLWAPLAVERASIASGGIMEVEGIPGRVVTVAPTPPQGAASSVMTFESARPLGEASRRNSGLTEEESQFLRGVYAREASRVVKEAIVSGLARSGGVTNDQWLLQLVRNSSEDGRIRSLAMSRLRSDRFPVAEISKLYDSATDRQLRTSIISVLGAREEDAATDKLFEIARSGTDPQLRRQAISALSRKKDPRTTKLLLELIER